MTEEAKAARELYNLASSLIPGGNHYITRFEQRLDEITKRYPWITDDIEQSKSKEHETKNT